MQRVDRSSIVDLDRLPAQETDRAVEICVLDDALVALAQMDPRRAQVIELRFFGGLSVDALPVAKPRRLTQPVTASARQFEIMEEGTQVTDTVASLHGGELSAEDRVHPRTVGSSTVSTATTLIGDGHGMHWPHVDEDLSADGMVNGIPGRRPATVKSGGSNPALQPTSRAQRNGKTKRRRARLAAERERETASDSVRLRRKCRERSIL